MAEFNLTPSSQNTPSPNPTAKQSLGVHPSLPGTTGPSTGPTVLTADLTASSSVPGPVLAHIQALESQIQALTSAHQADQGLRDELADIKRLLLLTTSHSAGGEAGGGGGKDRTQASVSGDKHQKQLATRGKYTTAKRQVGAGGAHQVQPVCPAMDTSDGRSMTGSRHRSARLAALCFGITMARSRSQPTMMEIRKTWTRMRSRRYRLEDTGKGCNGSILGSRGAPLGSAIVRGAQP